MVIVDTEERCEYLSPQVVFYFQPETFIAGTLTAMIEPFKTKKRIEWQVPGCFKSFSRSALQWKEEAQQGVTPNRSLPSSLNSTSSVRGSEDF